MSFTTKQITDISQIVKTAIDKLNLVEVIKTTIEDSLLKSVAELNDKVEVLRVDINQIRAENEKMRTILDNRDDKLEQYTRRNNFRIFGVIENAKEDVEAVVRNMLKKKLNLDFQQYAIERTHRTGKRMNGKPRAIIVRMANFEYKLEIFQVKKGLKDTGVSIAEDLTNYRVQVLKEAMSEFHRKNVWTYDGKIVIRLKREDKPNFIETMEELHQLILEAQDPGRYSVALGQSP